MRDILKELDIDFVEDEGEAASMVRRWILMRVMFTARMIP